MEVAGFWIEVVAMLAQVLMLLVQFVTTLTQVLMLLVQIATSLVLAVTLVVFFFQLLAMRSASRAQNILSALQYIQEPETREARKHVIQIVQGKDFSVWDDNDRRKVSTVCSTYDILGILIRQELIPLQIVTENWGRSIRLCYPVCEPWIRKLRESEGPEYWDEFEWLYKQAQ